MRIKLTSIMVDDQDKALKFYTELLGFRAMFAQGIPLAAFEVNGIEKEFARLKSHGVAFTVGPGKTGPVNLIQMSSLRNNPLQCPCLLALA